jgi:hypothetical protein
MSIIKQQTITISISNPETVKKNPLQCYELSISNPATAKKKNYTML